MAKNPNLHNIYYQLSHLYETLLGTNKLSFNLAKLKIEQKYRTSNGFWLDDLFGLYHNTAGRLFGMEMDSDLVPTQMNTFFSSGLWVSHSPMLLMATAELSSVDA